MRGEFSGQSGATSKTGAKAVRDSTRVLSDPAHPAGPRRSPTAIRPWFRSSSSRRCHWTTWATGHRQRAPPPTWQSSPGTGPPNRAIQARGRSPRTPQSAVQCPRTSSTSAVNVVVSAGLAWVNGICCIKLPAGDRVTSLNGSATKGNTTDPPSQTDNAAGSARIRQDRLQGRFESTSGGDLDGRNVRRSRRRPAVGHGFPIDHPVRPPGRGQHGVHPSAQGLGVGQGRIRGQQASTRVLSPRCSRQQHGHRLPSGVRPCPGCVGGTMSSSPKPRPGTLAVRITDSLDRMRPFPASRVRECRRRTPWSRLQLSPPDIRPRGGVLGGHIRKRVDAPLGTSTRPPETN